MTDIRPDAFGEEAMSGDERWHLEHAEFDIAANHHDYGNSDLLAVLRVGYALGVADGKVQRDREAWHLPRGKHKNYPMPNKPERIVDDPVYHGWWQSSCPICGKTAREYTEHKVFQKISGHIMGAHAQWSRRGLNDAKDYM